MSIISLPSFRPESLALTIGILFLSTAFSSILYGITCVQCFSYSRTWVKSDPKWIPTLIWSIWIFNTFHVILNYHIAYYYLISASSNPILYFEAVWSISINELIVGIVTIQVYGFYIWRLWILNRGTFNRLLCIFLSTLTVGNFAVDLFTCIVWFTDKRFKTLQELESQSSVVMKSVQIFSGLAASMELITAVALSWHLKKSSTGYSATKSTINALIAYTVNTGFISSINLIFLFISVFIWPDTYLWCFFAFLVPPLGSNACLGALNGRNYFKHFGNETDNTSFAMSVPSAPNFVEMRVCTGEDNVGTGL